jgi:hypothetical protein
MNGQTIHDLYLEVVLSGGEFDGALEFNTVELEAGGKKYLLDTIETEGFNHSDSEDENNSIYVLMSKFETDESETMDVFSDFDEYDFSVNLENFLKSDDIKAVTNLYREDFEKESEANIGRIKSLTLKSRTDSEFSIKVNQDNSI